MKYPKHTKKLLNSQVLILSRRLEQIFSQTIGYQKDLLKSYLKLGIIDEKYVRELDAEWGAPAGCYEFDYAEEEFVDLYFAIVKYSLPDLEWSSRDLEEEILWDLYGAAYGFTYHGE